MKSVYEWMRRVAWLVAIFLHFTYYAQAQTSNLPPRASFTATPSSGITPLIVRLDASASSDPDGLIVSYSWVSSDGQTIAGTTPSTSMTFRTPGAYTITLTVADNGGATA